jgi:hypothetical protein
MLARSRPSTTDVELPTQERLGWRPEGPSRSRRSSEVAGGVRADPEIE